MTTTDRCVLVTGGTGSIGSEIVRQLLPTRPATIRILSRDETKQFELDQELSGERDRIRYLIGDVRDESRLRRAMRDVDVVFHAAAMKHVPACEYNPFEAVQTNVIGTQNVIQAALDAGVSKVVSISTDKAINPGSTMGATKLLSEKVLAAAQQFIPRGPGGRMRLALSSVRFGNVLGSRGSIVPLVRRQIETGGPVTLTDARMTRFVMPIGEAARLVVTAGQRANGGETFILKMKALRVVDLLEALVRIFGGGSPIEIQEIGRRPGEVLDHYLLTEEEADRVVVEDDMFVIHKFGPGRGPDRPPIATSEYFSADAPFLTGPEIEALLRGAGLAP